MCLSMTANAFSASFSSFSTRRANPFLCCFAFRFAEASLSTWAFLAISLRDGVTGVAFAALAFAALVFLAGGAAACAAALVCEHVLLAGAVGGTAVGKLTRCLYFGFVATTTGLDVVVGATL